MLEEIMDAVPMPLVHVRMDATIGALNAPARALLGAEALGRHHVSVLRHPELVEQIARVRATGQGAEASWLRHEAGREAHYRVSISPLGAPPGGLMLGIEDRTGSEEVNEMRSQFVANVSHELRSPLTALSGFIETLQGPAADDAEARERFLEIMAREVRRMERLVGDLLALSRVEAQARRRPAGEADLAQLVREAVETLEPAARARDVRIEVEGCRDGCRLPGDADQLRLVVGNLLENAIKYGREGGRVQVRLGALRPGEGGDGAAGSELTPLQSRPRVVLEVQDQGEGIEPHHLGRLTERFYRIDTHRAREAGGTGLGLAIVKHVVNRHRGRLTIASTPGEGSVFRVILPRA